MAYDVILVGGGIMGATTAQQLCRAGKKVLVLEQYNLMNERNASQDFNKAYRCGYAGNSFYAELAYEAGKRWEALERELRTQVLHRCGTLMLSLQEHDEYAEKSAETFRKLSYNFQEWGTKQIKEKFPQFNAKRGFYEPEGGFVHAAAAVEACFMDAHHTGNLTLLEHEEVEEITENKVITKNKRGFFAEQVIVTAGAWAQKLLDLPFRPTAQALTYLKPKKSWDFMKKQFPVWAYLNEGFYGFPLHGINAVKTSTHFPGETHDPREAAPSTEAFELALKKFLKEAIPNLAEAEAVNRKVCYYSMTESEDFIIDRLPSGVIVAAGFSGHGFKFAPLVGEWLATMALGKKLPEYCQRFAISAHF